MRGGVGCGHDPREACERKPQPMDRSGLPHKHTGGREGGSHGGGGGAFMGQSDGN